MLTFRVQKGPCSIGRTCAFHPRGLYIIRFRKDKIRICPEVFEQVTGQVLRQGQSEMFRLVRVTPCRATPR